MRSGQTERAAAGAQAVDGFVAGVGSHVFHDAVNVIFDGEFGKMQPCSDFLVGETLRDKCHEPRHSLGYPQPP